MFWLFQTFFTINLCEKFETFIYISGWKIWNVLNVLCTLLAVLVEWWSWPGPNSAVWWWCLPTLQPLGVSSWGRIAPYVTHASIANLCRFKICKQLFHCCFDWYLANRSGFVISGPFYMDISLPQSFLQQAGHCHKRQAMFRNQTQTTLTTPQNHEVRLLWLTLNGLIPKLVALMSNPVL